MNDTQNPEVQVSTLFTFDIISALPMVNKPLPSPKERMAAIVLGKIEMATSTAELHMSWENRSSNEIP